MSLPNELQQARLAGLIEDAARVIQAAARVLHHGYNGHDLAAPPGVTHRVELEIELARLRTAVIGMEAERDIKARPVFALERRGEGI